MEPDTNNHEPERPAITPAPQSEQLNAQLVDWLEHLDRLVSHGAEAEQIDYCNQQIDRLTKALQGEADPSSRADR